MWVVGTPHLGDRSVGEVRLSARARGSTVAAPPPPCRLVGSGRAGTHPTALSPLLCFLSWDWGSGGCVCFAILASLSPSPLALHAL